ncbi:hypothetical protein Snoj_30060 [Streptomyces nojiriensis]|uniref:Uncharacterized protein n=1 Tax=Streptomyces nojiriensis TaxID=66374 RepID=A0ABQ3SLT2_9ACTN|nr:hypothetical protein JYK04_00429 [Streptomyces nojiriensis]GGS16016.1 hypothetical protein GCM10010205_52240 [Streptomyces nojiriensis]GHI69088.1 hypothetical protein Snoj_30060 [Streptomyces nojiriensis]
MVVDSNKDALGMCGDQTLGGFHAGAQGDIEVYEARDAEDIATGINSGGKVSPLRVRRRADSARAGRRTRSACQGARREGRTHLAAGAVAVQLLRVNGCPAKFTPARPWAMRLRMLP